MYSIFLYYFRSETVASIVLQRKSVSKRIYAIVINTKSNSDGYKVEGITFPGQESMVRLMRETYQEVNLDPKDTKYIEGHVTGTQAGDPIECGAIETVFCPNDRTDPVLIGCLKSNAGHAEGASGVLALVKVCLIMQKGSIPANINLNDPNPNIVGILNGKLKPVTTVTPFNQGNISINSAGFGGTNVHSIVQSYDGVLNENIHNLQGYKGINRLILFKARNEKSFELLEEKIQNNPQEITIEFLDLLSNISSLDGTIFHLPFRGYFILDRDKKIIQKGWIHESMHIGKHNHVMIITKYPEGASYPFNKILNNITYILKTVGIKYKIITTEQENDHEDEINTISVNEFISLNDILKIIGYFYISNQVKSVNLFKLYPRIKYPVSKGTSSISPLFKWNHDTKWPVYKVTKYFKNSSQNRWLHFDYATLYNHLQGHVIDGRIIFPTTQYLWSVWISLAMDQIYGTSDSFLETGIKFWNVKINSAIIVNGDDTISLQIRIDSTTGSFNIVHKGTCVVNGYAQLTYDQKVPLFNERNNLNNRNIGQNIRILCKEDFYKELRVRGYDYIQDFQGVNECNIDGSGGTVKLLRNWVCFADSVLQLALINDPTRSLYLPTGFDFLQIDPTVFKDNSSIIEFGTYKLINTSLMSDEGSLSGRNKNQTQKTENVQLFKVRIEKDTKEIFTDGFYIKGMKANPAPRRKVLPRVRKHMFKPFNELNEQESEETRNSKESYEKICLDVMKSKNDFNNNDFNNEDLKTKEENQEGINEENNNNSNHCLLTVLKKFKSNHENISFKEWNEKKLVLSKDLLLQIPIDTHDSILHQYCIVNETFTKKRSNVIEINSSSKESIHDQIECVLNKYNIQHEYTYIINDPFGTKVRRWLEDGNDNQNDESDMNEILKSKMIDSNLIVIQHPSLGFQFVENDEELNLREEKFDDSIKSVFKNSKYGSFVIVLFRKDLTYIEKEIMINNNFLPQENDIISRMQSEGGVVISTKSIGSYVSILSRSNMNRNNMYGHKKRQIYEIDQFSYDWVGEIKNEIYKSENGEDPNGNSFVPINQDPVWIVSHGSCPSGLYGFINSVRKEDQRFRGIQIMNEVSDSFNSVGFNKDDIIEKCIKYDLCMTIIINGTFGSVYTTDLNGEEMRNETNENVSNLINTEDEDQQEIVTCFLDVTTKGDLSSLKYFKKKIPYESYDHVIDVQYSALNFKDIMVSSGRVPLSAYPDSIVRKRDTGNLGMEFSGTNVDGKRVMGFTTCDAIATKIDAGSSNSNFLFNIPDNITLEEAATIPVVYSTVYYALIIRGKLIEKESVLIHAGSGGVGQAAINVCLSMDCEIYTTVGTEEKRKFIKETFPSIKDDHIFDSRSVSFGDDLLRATDGKGVDVILNSLSEEMLQIGLTCLADNGRFIEIGKYDMVIDSLFGQSHPLYISIYLSLLLYLSLSLSPKYM